MTLQELYDCVEAIYRAGWQDALDGKRFDPQIPSHGYAQDCPTMGLNATERRSRPKNEIGYIEKGKESA